MRRRRDVAADPARTTKDTWDAIVSLIAACLPALPAASVSQDLQAAAPFVKYLVSTEILAELPLTLCAGTLACDIYTVHGDDAISLEDPSLALGATNARDWTLYIPTPDDAPFSRKDVRAAGSLFRPGPAPDGAGEASTDAVPSRLRELVDPDALRSSER